jgi:hypothetical protein
VLAFHLQNPTDRGALVLGNFEGENFQGEKLPAIKDASG